MKMTKQDMAKNIVVAFYNLKNLCDIEKYEVTKRHYDRLLKMKKECLKKHHERALKIINGEK